MYAKCKPNMSFSAADACLAKAPEVHRKFVRKNIYDFTMRILGMSNLMLNFKVNHQNKIKLNYIYCEKYNDKSQLFNFASFLF